MKDNPSPEEMARIKEGTMPPYGLQPRMTMGDGDTTGSKCFYVSDSTAYESIKLFADTIGEIDPGMGAEYAAEAEKYRKDLWAAVNESIVFSPVIKARDGTYRSFHPQGFHDRGPRSRTAPEGVNIFAHCGLCSSDIVVSSAAIESGLRSGLLSMDDPRVEGHFDVLEDAFLVDNPWIRKRTKDYNPETQWFGNAGWGYQSGWERLPDYYLMRDDVPNFLRAWLNRMAVDANFSNWSFNEHTTFAPNDKSHGRAVFLSNFRNMLVLRFRHPKAAPIKVVTVNGKDWKEFSAEKETITLKGLAGTVTVTATY